MQALQTYNTYSIGQFAKIVNLSAPTIRYYEREGLLTAQRDAGGRRYFTQKDIDWVKFLRHLKGTGMSIQELKQYVQWRAQGDTTIPDRLALLKQTQAEILEKYHHLQHHLQILNDKIAWYEDKESGQHQVPETFKDYLAQLGHSE